MFPNEKRELSADWQAAQKTRQKDGPAGCEKAWGGLQKRAALRTALFRSPV